MRIPRKLLYVQYLTDCLHMVYARPNHTMVWCPGCREYRYAIELRKAL